MNDESPLTNVTSGLRMILAYIYRPMSKNDDVCGTPASAQPNTTAERVRYTSDNKRTNDKIGCLSLSLYASSTENESMRPLSEQIAAVIGVKFSGCSDALLAAAATSRSCRIRRLPTVNVVIYHRVINHLPAACRRSRVAALTRH